jgi:calcium-translocating P-type ATPase
VAVGEQSRWGKTKAKLAAETEATPLQEKLDILAGQIGNFGIVTAVATFFAMIGIWYYFPDSRDEGQTFFEFVIKAFIMGVTIVVVAVPEGLPLAVTLSLAYSTQKMMTDNNLIRVLAACETMGNATNICSDKTGTLTQNRMTVVEGWVAGKHYKDCSQFSSLPKAVVDRIAEGAALNSTANIMVPGADGAPVVAGSKTEGALLVMLQNQFQLDYVPLRAQFNSARGDRLITFSSARKRMSVVLANGPKGQSGVAYTKGAAEIILARSTKYVNASGKEVTLDAATRSAIGEAIASMAKNALRAVAQAHKNVAAIRADMNSDDFDTDMTIDAVFGIKDPLRRDVPDSVRRCQEAGIFVRMVTGDNIETAKAIAKECGILTEGGVALEGPDFRKLTPKQLDAVLPTLQVLARSSPDDKHILVTRLNGHALPEDQAGWEGLHAGCVWDKERDLFLPGYKAEWEASRAKAGGVGEVVGVTGDGTNDGPALKAADVGLSMGLSGTDGE